MPVVSQRFGPAELFPRSILAAALVAAVSGAAGTEAASARRLPAFPGAQGFGANTPGGRGGRVLEVTNLDADGPGSLQAACRARGPRIVVFRVGGIIQGPVHVTEPFLTIAGQTAPGDGICLKDGPLNVETHDVVIRHIRVRPGDSPLGYTPEHRDCIQLYGLPDTPCHDVIVDHCSGSWGTDENFQAFGDTHNVTFQWCISSESLHDSLHPEGPHGKGMIIGCRNATITVHHCLLAHHADRNPLIICKRRKEPCTFDVRNNVIYRQGRSFSQAYGNLWLNYVGNYLKVREPLDPCTRFGVLANNPWPECGQVRIYVRDNIWPWRNDGEQDEWGIVHAFVNGKRTYTRFGKRVSEPVAAPAVTTEPAEAAYESVLGFAGCTRPARDVVDARIVSEVRAGTGSFIDSQNEVGGWPVYASGTSLADADHDGMPDRWEEQYGLVPKDAGDGPKDADGDGYTNVEEFLNETDPRKPDTGAPAPPDLVRLQVGNEHIRGEAARKAGQAWLAKTKQVNATSGSEAELARDVRTSGKEVADLLGIAFVRISAGVLTVGTSKVTLTEPFELSACEITQAQWQRVMGTRPWSGQLGVRDEAECPVTYVNYLDCHEFTRRMNVCGERVYGLPTCCEWLHAARAGTDSRFGFGSDERRRIDEYAWQNLRRSPQPVGRLKPNPWGLYDMAGNTQEWVHGWAHLSWERWHRYLAGHGAVDPQGRREPSGIRGTCGGSFLYRTGEFFQYYPYVTHRSHYRGPAQGFRLRRAVP